MTIRLVDAGWGRELTEALDADNSDLQIICPFIKTTALNRLLSSGPEAIRVITRFNLEDFAEGVSNTLALRNLLEGAVIFIARLTQDPNDIRIFGRAVGLKHVPGRDDATDEDIAQRSWKATWPRYIRVHHAEFVAGTMANGISLNELMETLGADSFAPTQRNAARGEGNTDPRKAYRQQAAVELSGQGLSWLSHRLQEAFDTHGQVPQEALGQLDWPVLP